MELVATWGDVVVTYEAATGAELDSLSCRRVIAGKPKTGALKRVPAVSQPWLTNHSAILRPNCYSLRIDSVGQTCLLHDSNHSLSNRYF